MFYQMLLDYCIIHYSILSNERSATGEMVLLALNRIIPQYKLPMTPLLFKNPRN